MASKTDERQGTDADSHTTYYDRTDGTGRINQIRYPDTASETFDYNGFGQVTRHRRKNGNYEHFEYDGNGRLLKRWNPTANPSPSYADPYTSFEYYPSGHPWADRVWKETDPRRHWTTYEYDVIGLEPVAARGLVTKITHCDGTWKSSGYDRFGNKLWDENERREHTDYAYDDYNRLLSATPPLPALPTGYSYEPTFGIADPYLHTTRSVHLKSVTTAQNVTEVTEMKYDENFRLKTVAQLDGTTNPPTTRNDYDEIGNLITVREPRGYPTVFTYDHRNRKETQTDTLNHTTGWGYDFASNITSILRPDNQTETNTYDAMNRVMQHVEPVRLGVNKTTRFDYWPSGQAYHITDDNSQVTTFDYDPSDLKTVMLYPDGTSYQAWGYDKAKNLTSRQTVGGKTQTFYYDCRNRQTNMRWDSGVDDWADFGYDDAGRMTNANNGYAAVTRTYDPAGRMILEQQNIYGLGEKDVQYNYDGAGKQTNLGLVGTDYQFTYSYDAIGRFAQIVYVGSGATGGASDAWFQYSYDAASNETQRYCAMNGVAQIYDRDELGRMRTLTVENVTAPHYRTSAPTVLGSTGGAVSVPLPVQVPGLLAGLSNLTSGATGIPVPPVGTVQSAESYGYDEMSRLLTATRQEDGQSDTSSFTYDYSGQLTNASYGWNGRNMGYTLDNVGNRTQTNDNGSIGTYTRNPSYLNQYIAASGGGVNNGSEHEIAGYQGLSYTYYGDRRLASIVGNGHSYYLYYDALGRCVRRELNGVRTFYVYDGEKPIYEYDVNGVRAGWNLYGKGIDEIVLRSDYVVLTHGQGYFYQQDHEGSVTHLMGFEGTRIERYRYDAFGAPTTTYTGGSFNNRFKFTGREYAEAFGIYEYRNRAYHPGLGRFTNEDPKGFEAGDYNLFRYGGNDPVDRTDPMGLEGLTDQNTPVVHGAPGTSATPQVDPRVEREYREQAVRMMDAKQVDRAAAAISDNRLRALVPNAINSLTTAIKNHPADFKQLNVAKQAAGAVIKAFFAGKIQVGQQVSFKASIPMYSQLDRTILVNPSFLDRRGVALTIPSLLAHEGGHAVEPVPFKDDRGEIFAQNVQKDFDAALHVNSFMGD